MNNNNLFLLPALHAGLGLMPAISQAQTRPNVVWMAGGSVNRTLLAFSPDGTQFAAGIAYWDSVVGVSVWSRTGRLLETIRGANFAAFSPDGNGLYSPTPPQESYLGLGFWNLSSGLRTRLLGAATSPVAANPQQGVLAVAPSVGSRFIQIRDFTLATLRTTLTNCPTTCTALAFSTDGTLAAMRYDTNAVVVNWSQRTNLLTLALDTADPLPLAFLPDGTALAVADGAEVKLFSVPDGRLLLIFMGHDSSAIVGSLSVSPDGKLVASLDDQGQLLVWSVTTGQVVHNRSSVTSALFSPNGVELGLTVTGGDVQFEQISDWTTVASLEAVNRGVIRSIAFSPDGRYLASAVVGSDGQGDQFYPNYFHDWTNDTVVRVWNVADGSLFRTLEGHSSGVPSVAFSSQGVVAAGASDGTIRLWQISDGSLLQTLPTPEDLVLSLAFSPDGSQLVVASTTAPGCDYSSITLWSVADGSLIMDLEDGGEAYESVAFGSDGTTIARASVAGGAGVYSVPVRLWSAVDFSNLGDLIDPSNPFGTVLDVDLSPDMQNIVLGVAGPMSVVKINGDALVRSITSGGWRCVFSPDGKYLAGIEEDYDIGGNYVALQVHRVSNGQLMAQYTEECKLTTSIRFSPSGEYLAYGRQDGTLVLARNPVFVRPTVALVPSSAGLSLQWPTNATNFVLQSATTLANGGDWLDATLKTTVVGDQNAVTVDMTNLAGFYRLRGL